MPVLCLVVRGRKQSKTCGWIWRNVGWLGARLVSHDIRGPGAADVPLSVLRPDFVEAATHLSRQTQEVCRAVVRVLLHVVIPGRFPGTGLAHCF